MEPVRKMRKATNINEFTNNFLSVNVIDKTNAEFYVPIYDEIIDDIRSKILYDELDNQTLFIAGQAGTGKTTALNFFENDEIAEKYDVKIIRGRDLFDPNDIDIIDILLMFGFTLVKDNKNLKNKYLERLQKIQKIQDGIMEEVSSKTSGVGFNAGAGIGGKIGFNFLKFFETESELSFSFKADKEFRKEIREIFKLKKNDLLKMINEMINAYYEEKDSTKRKLLFIIDDLEKLREQSQINSIFIENKFFIYSIKCKKIVAIPIHLINNPAIFGSNDIGNEVNKFIIKLKQNPIKDESVDDKEELVNIEKNKQLMRKIVYKRIENNELIEKEAIDEAIEKSGGVLRQFSQILYNAGADVRRLKGQKISKNDAVKGWERIKSIMDGTIISGERIKLLESIVDNHKPTDLDSDTFIDCILNLQIIVNQNGSVWYEVNPIIEKTVKIYANK